MFMAIGVIPAVLVVLIRLGVKGDRRPSNRPRLSQAAGQPPKHSILMLIGVGLAAFAVAMAPALIGGLNQAGMLKWVYFIDAPIGLAGLWIFRKHWKMALYVVLLMTAFNFFSHGSQDLYPTFPQPRGDHKLGHPRHRPDRGDREHRRHRRRHDALEPGPSGWPVAAPSRWRPGCRCSSCRCGRFPIPSACWPVAPP